MTGFGSVGLGFISLWWGSTVLGEWMGQDRGSLAPWGLRLNENHKEACLAFVF